MSTKRAGNKTLRNANEKLNYLISAVISTDRTNASKYFTHNDTLHRSCTSFWFNKLKNFSFLKKRMISEQKLKISHYAIHNRITLTSSPPSLAYFTPEYLVQSMCFQQHVFLCTVASNDKSERNITQHNYYCRGRIWRDEHSTHTHMYTLHHTVLVRLLSECSDRKPSTIGLMTCAIQMYTYLLSACGSTEFLFRSIVSSRNKAVSIKFHQDQVFYPIAWWAQSNGHLIV